MSHFAKRSRLGFTLIELLVVIAIIAILAAILFPVFQKVRENARRAACESNIKQMGLSMMQYNQDNDESFPCGYNYNRVGNANTGIGAGWAGTMAPYTKSTALFTCPDDSTASGGATGGLYPISYGQTSNMNRNLVGGTIKTVIQTAISNFNAPASTVLVFEVVAKSTAANLVDLSHSPENISGTYFSPAGNGYILLDQNSATATGVYMYDTGYLGNRAPTASGETGPSSQGTIFNNPTGRHSDGANYMMADGHAKYFRPSQISSGYDATNATDPQGTNQAAGTQGLGNSFAVTFSKL